jgi:acyl-CoA reductase-like NAD-dependent aldehyde dehydrogenase
VSGNSLTTQALYIDVTRSLELGAVIGEIRENYDNVETWAKPERAAFSLNFFAMRPVIRKEAKGTVLVMGPFNYPIWCTLGPVVRLTVSCERYNLICQ